MNNPRLETIRKYPETVIRTVDHGVIFVCPKCGMEIDRSSIAIRGNTITRSSPYKDFPYDAAHNDPKCPHCYYTNHGVLSFNTLRSYNVTYAMSFFRPPIDYKKARKFEHITKIKRGWFGKEIVVDSVIEIVDIE